MKKKMSYFILLLTTLFMFGCTEIEDATIADESTTSQEETTDTEKQTEETAPEEEKANANSKDEESATAATEESATDDEQFSGYNLIEVDGGDLSGSRQANVAVDIGYGDREYWAFTNDHGQLVRVIADEIILQDDSSEPVLSSGRYYSDEAKVPGVESEYLDEGHVIADALGGVSNAYNITPQESTLNRHGDQAYMERSIREAGGATNFEAIITYPDTKTHIPSSYKYTYTLMGNEVIDTFDNVNPDKVNESLGLTDSKSSESTNSESSSDQSGDLSSVDTNGNGKVTTSEAKAAGFSMPITSDHWLNLDINS